MEIMRLSPKEKAEELVLRYLRIDNNTKEWFNSYIAKQCALIAVDEILQIFNNEWTKLDFWTEEINGTINFWQEVKKEIEKL
jgi:hypothetical protein